jgi:hypothetical protein
MALRGLAGGRVASARLCREGRIENRGWHEIRSKGGMQDSALNSCLFILLTEVLPVVVIAAVAAAWLHKVLPRDETRKHKGRSRSAMDPSLLLRDDPAAGTSEAISSTRKPQLW